MGRGSLTDQRRDGDENNRKGKPNHSEQKRKAHLAKKAKTTTMDLALVSRGEEGMCEWEILDQDTGSNHALIKITYDTEEEHVQELGDKKQYRKVDWDKVREQLGKELNNSREEWKIASDNEDDEVMARILREDLNKAINEGVPRTKTTWRSKAWFDEEVKQKRRKLAEAGK